MFCTVKWLACFVLSNDNTSTDASGRGLHCLQKHWRGVNTHPARCETALLEHFYECEQVVKIVVW